MIPLQRDGSQKTEVRSQKPERHALGLSPLAFTHRHYMLYILYNDALLLVVHVYREDDVNGEEIIRIISAREANQRERRIYIQQAAE